jgi:hypothetical protein
VRCYLACVCENAIVSAPPQSGVSLISLVDAILAPGYPVIIPRLAAVFLFIRDTAEPEAVELTFRVTLDVDAILEVPAQISFAGKPTSRLQFDLGGFPVPRAGKLIFTVSQGDQELANWKVDATTSTEVTPPTPVPSPAIPAAAKPAV